MAVKTHIIDPQTKLHAEVVNGEELNALVVANRPLKNFTKQAGFFENPIEGSNMNVNGSATGTPLLIHNGIDTVLWTASTIVGNATDFDFNDPAQNNTLGGAFSIDCSNAEGGDQFQLLNTSDLNLNDYTALTMWVFSTGLWTLPGDGLDIILYNTTSGTQVSANTVNLDNYVDGSNTGVWQQAVIPIADFGITTPFDAIRCTMTAGGSPPNFFLDDVQLETEGAPISYEIQPKKNCWLFVEKITFSFVGPFDSTLLNNSMPNLDYNALLNIPELTVGIRFSKVKDTEVLMSMIFKNLIDFLQYSDVKIVDVGSNGTDTFLTIDLNFVEPILLKEEDADKLEIVISDDLSSFNHFKVSYIAKEEDRRINYKTR